MACDLGDPQSSSGCNILHAVGGYGRTVNEIVILRKTDTIAVLLPAGADPESSRPLATVYLMKDGWHMKLTHRHDRFAWSGPFAEPDHAIDLYTPGELTGPVLRIA